MEKRIVNFFGIKVSLLGFIIGTVTVPITYLFFKKLFKKIIVFFNNRKV